MPLPLIHRLGKTASRIAPSVPLALIWSAGVFLALGSQSYDAEDEIELPPVIVEIDINNVESIEFDNGDTADLVTNTTLFASYSKPANDRISLLNVPVTLDTGTSLDITVTPEEADNLLRGDIELEVTSALEFGVNRVPEQGQLSISYDSTTTMVDFDGDANNIVLQTGGGTQTILTFDDFRARFLDNDLNIHERVASKAYRLLENIWKLARIAENVHTDIEEQLDTLQSMGTGEPLSLNCDNVTTDANAEYNLLWASDVADPGTAGNGDSFFANWNNCELSGEERYLDRDLTINNYRLANAAAPRSMSFNADFGAVFVALDPISVELAAIDRDRVIGIINVNVEETVTTQ